MVPSWKWRAFRVAEWPVEVSLVTTSCFADLAADAKTEAQKPRPVPRDLALALFDRCGRESTALRSFLRDNGLGPDLERLGDGAVFELVRRELAVGALVAIEKAEERKPVRSANKAKPRPAADSPIPIQRGPAPPEPEGPEVDEFPFPAAQAQVLSAAAASGTPFCAECARAAAARAAAGSN